MKLLFLRHGECFTRNRSQPLTIQGKELMGNALQGLRGIIRGEKDVALVSSLDTAAIESAEIIYRSLEMPDERWSNCVSLDSPNPYSGQGEVLLVTLINDETSFEHAYMSHNRFDSGTDLERRSVVRARSFGYLADILKKYLAGALPSAVIHVSHFEVLYPLVQIYKPDPPLRHAEIIEFTLMPGNIRGGVKIYINFRQDLKRIDVQAPFTDLAQKFGW